jgi:uncharacterized protein YkwD
MEKLLMLLPILGGIMVPSFLPKTAPPNSNFRSEVIKLTNEFREDNGLKPLKLNVRLNRSAQGHSADMATRDFFSHRNPDGLTAGNRASIAGYDYSRLGENIAAGQRTAKQVVNAWKKSPEHRQNMLDPRFEEIGVGYIRVDPDPGNVTYQVYWVQNFGKQ